MTTSAISYSSKTTITIAPASLASSSTYLSGVESDQIDNTSNLYIDAIVEALVTVGTTPTANTTINIYVWGSNDSAASINLDAIDGASSAETITSAGILAGLFRLAAVAVVDATTSNRAYPLAPFSVAALFGGTMPAYWGIYLAHNTGAALNSTSGNHVFTYRGVKVTTA